MNSGERYLPQEVATELAQRLDRSQLSDREINVLQLVARGQTNKEIGLALHIAEITVKQHVGHILTKLGASDRPRPPPWRFGGESYRWNNELAGITGLFDGRVVAILKYDF